MMPDAIMSTTAPSTRRLTRKARWSRGLSFRWERLGRLERLSLAAFGLVTVFLLAVPLLVNHSPTEIVGPSLQGPSAAAPLGTDELGRDLLVRTLYGMRLTWFIVFPVIASGLLIGGLVGGIAGFRGGRIDTLLMRGTDVALALPGTLVTLAIAASLGRGLGNTLIAIMATFWPPYARIMRGEVKRISSLPHVEAATLGGITKRRLVLVHIVPGLSGPMLVQATLDISTVILILAGLSFLGFGQQPPAPELGTMTAAGIPYVLSAWWVPTIPAIGVFILSLIGNFSGDAVADMVEE